MLPEVFPAVIGAKNISVQKGEQVLSEQVRYFFYITNHRDFGAEEIGQPGDRIRCNQENVIEQLKNGVNAMRMPVRRLTEQLGLHGDDGPGLEPQGLVGCCCPMADAASNLSCAWSSRRFLHSLILYPLRRSSAPADVLSTAS